MKNYMTLDEANNQVANSGGDKVNYYIPADSCKDDIRRAQEYCDRNGFHLVFVME